MHVSNSSMKDRSEKEILSIDDKILIDKYSRISVLSYLMFPFMEKDPKYKQHYDNLQFCNDNCETQPNQNF